MQFDLVEKNMDKKCERTHQSVVALQQVVGKARAEVERSVAALAAVETANDAAEADAKRRLAEVADRKRRAAAFPVVQRKGEHPPDEHGVASQKSRRLESAVRNC